jgi:hypothetical protein
VWVKTRWEAWLLEKEREDEDMDYEDCPVI